MTPPRASSRGPSREPARSPARGVQGPDAQSLAGLLTGAYHSPLFPVRGIERAGRIQAATGEAV